MKKALAIIIALAMCIGLAACGGSGSSSGGSGSGGKKNGPKPEDTVEKVCKAIQGFDAAAIDACVDGSAGAAAAVEDIEGVASGLAEVMKKEAAKVEYKLGSAGANGDAAAVQVLFDYTDATRSVRAVMDNYVEAVWDFLTNAEDLQSVTDDFADELFTKAIEDRWDAVENDRKTVEVTFPLIKKDGAWLLAALPEEVLTILTSNVGTAIDEYMDWGGEGDSGTAYWSEEWLEHNYYVWNEHGLKEVEAGIGEKLAFANSQIVVTDFRQVQELENIDYHYEPAGGAKFLVFDYTVTNTGKEPINFSSEMLYLCNDKDWLYEEFSDDYLFIDNFLWNVGIAPGGSESSSVIFYVPDDIPNDRYYLAVTDMDKTVYKVYGK